MLKNSSVDDCIAKSPPEIQAKLKELRKFIKSKIPGAEETISYGIPTYKLNGKSIIFFAGYKGHISIYPAPRGEAAFKKELSDYKGGKGTLQLPNNKPVPFDLIEKIIKFRLKQFSVK